MNLSEIESFVGLAQWTGCIRTQEFFSSSILYNFPLEIAQLHILSLEFPSFDRRYICYFKRGPRKSSKYIYTFRDGHIRKQELRVDRSKPRGGTSMVGKVEQLPHNNRLKICDKVTELLKTHSLVEVDIGAGKGDHSFLLLYISEKIYILDSFAKIRTPEIREFDLEEFKDYILNGTLDSYNKTFKTNFECKTKIGNLRDIHISVCEW